MKRTTAAIVAGECSARASLRDASLRSPEPPARSGAASSGCPSARISDGAVDALRSRLAGSTAREHVVLDFLEDDLREVRGALAAVAAYVANVEAALADGEPSQHRLLSLALGGKPADRIEELATAVAGVRRRLAQVAARM
jgi:hypothetical protein